MSATPTCPACCAKFSHSKAMARCIKCGLPDEIREAGGHAIHIWKKGKLPFASAQPQVEFKQSVGARASRKPNKHGRKGVKRAY